MGAAFDLELQERRRLEKLAEKEKKRKAIARYHDLKAATNELEIEMTDMAKELKKFTSKKHGMIDREKYNDLELELM